MTRFSDFEDEDIEYSLSVSQFAKLCGTTRDTLRYYYEQNILTPRVDPNNGYHYYSASQISSFFFINTMRKAGCSIKEISTTSLASALCRRVESRAARVVICEGFRPE